MNVCNHVWEGLHPESDFTGRLCTWQSNLSLSQPWIAGMWSDVHGSIRGIHSSCRTENRRQSCLPHSPSQKCYTAQLFPGLSIKSGDWRTQHSQSQAGIVGRMRSVLVEGKSFNVLQSVTYWVLQSFLSSPCLELKFILVAHGQNHHNKWMDTMGYATNLSVGLICCNENDLNEMIEFIENELDFK